MQNEVTKTEIGYRSHDGKTQIHALLWLPKLRGTIAPRGIVQLVHGMAEHIERYDDFARYLVGCGFVVCANDHAGHGKSVSDASEWGCLSPEEGAQCLVEDVHALRKLVAGRYSQKTPYFLFGHSMGSFIVRVYLARHAEGLAGAILSGTSHQSSSVSAAGHFLARSIARTKGSDYKSTFLHKQGAGAYSKQIANARTPFDWLSTDPAVVDAYAADEACGFLFSAGAYAALTSLTGEMVSRESIARIPRSLPLLFVSGSDDPVGLCGKAVQDAARQLRHAGMSQVDVNLYEGMRHEILNEPGHQRVYEDIVTWLLSTEKVPTSHA
ncbi:MAG: alpha/beta fold hydrolase [Raoultibacter sp.]